MTFDLQTIVMAAAIAIIGVWNILREYREYRASKTYGLKSNPHRCAESLARIGGLEERTRGIEGKLGRLEERVDGVREDIKEIKAKL